jgi:NAD+ synthase (glutamine-hydrolysing)
VTQLNLTAAQLGLVRVAVASPECRVADVEFNVQEIIRTLAQAAEAGAALAVFPELCITGYSCADLFYQPHLLEQAAAALHPLAEAAAICDIAALVGLPLIVDGRLYNCAAFLCNGAVVGITPKTYLPTTNEFYEERWFASAVHNRADHVTIYGAQIPFGSDLLFVAENQPGCVVGVEICEDLWAPQPPSGEMALAGATLLLNPSASTETLGKADYRRDLVRQQAARSLAAYLYAGAGPGESTTDVVYAGHSLISENGALLAETERFRFATQMAIADIDVQRLLHERLKNSTFAAADAQRRFRRIPFRLPRADAPWPLGDLIRPMLARTPFVPGDLTRRALHCQEIFAIQSTGLAKRLRHTGAKRVTIGVSGGLDSTLALLVIVRAFDLLGLPRDGVIAITMPGFGTTARTRGNAERLADLLGVTLRIIPIGPAVRQHFADIGHDEATHDVTYENAQARERTQILMDTANQVGGLVVGTGDLSEAALGWMTFNGDHMSMYHVNAGVPKTLVRYLVEWCAEAVFSGETSAVLRDICATPITPELLPLGENEQLEQKTEETIGPYELHDFFLFYTLRHQFPPAKVFFLALHAFGGIDASRSQDLKTSTLPSYTPAEILKWLGVFYRRFFSQQFKRSSMPDGPKVGSVALSPRGDWRMPSDASSALWLAEVERLSQHRS